MHELIKETFKLDTQTVVTAREGKCTYIAFYKHDRKVKKEVGECEIIDGKMVNAKPVNIAVPVDYELYNIIERISLLPTVH